AAERGRLLGAEAIEMARRVDQASTLADALSGYVNSRVSPDFTRQQVVVATELVDEALAAGDLERAAEGYQYRIESSIELGDLASVHADLDAITTLAEDLRQPAQKWVAGLLHAHVALLEGRFDEAERFIADSRSLGERVHAWEAAMYSGLQLYVLRREVGKRDECTELIRGWVRDAPTYPIWRCVLANTLAELGSTVDARAGLDALAADRFAAIPFDEEWEVSLGLLTEAAARLDDRGRAQ